MHDRRNVSKEDTCHVARYGLDALLRERKNRLEESDAESEAISSQLLGVASSHAE